MRGLVCLPGNCFSQRMTPLGIRILISAAYSFYRYWCLYFSSIRSAPGNSFPTYGTLGYIVCTTYEVYHIYVSVTVSVFQRHIHSRSTLFRQNYTAREGSIQNVTLLYLGLYISSVRTRNISSITAASVVLQQYVCFVLVVRCCSSIWPW